MCEICGTQIADGELRFLLTINVAADFDGKVPANGNIEDLEAFMRNMEKKSTKELENDVYQSQGYLLCPFCKKAFMENPLGLIEGPQGPKSDGRVH